MKYKLSAAAGMLAAALVTAILSGCNVSRHELPADCNVDFEFDYTFDPPGESLLPSLAGNIEVYAFNRRTGLLAAVIRIGKADIARGHMRANLPAGVYTFVCWATDGERITAGGYFPAHADNPAANIFSDIRIGETDTEEFRMMLDCSTLPAGSTGELVPKLINFDDLFFSMTDDVVVDGRSDVRVPFHFICDTSVLKVRISGLEILKTRMSGYTAAATRAGEEIPDVFVTAPHERYAYDNSLAPYSRGVRFEVPATYVAADTMAVDIKVQRLELAAYEARSVLLHIRDPATGESLIDPINVLAAIRAVTDENGDHPYEDQTDIDKQYEFEIAVDVSDGTDPGTDPGGPADGKNLNVNVKINQYEVINPGVKI